MLRNEPALLPVFTVDEAVVARLFGTCHPSPGTVGATVRAQAPLEYAEIISAGNVQACLGEGPIGLVVNAHYDHLGALPSGRFFPGATDNAAGVGVLLESARVLRELLWAPLPLRVVLLCTSGEEIGMAGARHFLARHGRDVRPEGAVLVVDEIGGPPEAPIVLMANADAAWAHELCDAVAAVGASVAPRALAGVGDALPFVEHGVRHVAALSAPDPQADVVHTVQDTPERISSSRLAQVGSAAVLAVLRLLQQVQQDAPEQ
jgi:Zn-dependent M28 family amino/carboxypeptidase